MPPVNRLNWVQGIDQELYFYDLIKKNFLKYFNICCYLPYTSEQFNSPGARFLNNTCLLYYTYKTFTS